MRKNNINSCSDEVERSSGEKPCYVLDCSDKILVKPLRKGYVFFWNILTKNLKKIVVRLRNVHVCKRPKIK